MTKLIAEALDAIGIAEDAEVMDLLDLAAQSLNYSLSVDKVSVRALTAQLDDIEAAAAHLAELVEQYRDDIDRAIAIEAMSLFSPYVLEDALEHDNTVSRLRRLSASAGSARGAIVAAFGSGDPDNPDPNGADLGTKLMGSPKRRFVEEIVHIVGARRPDLLATTKEGPLHRFVVDCWEWATGNPKAPGIPDDLAAVVPKLHAAMRDHAEAHQWEIAASNYRRLGLDKEAEEARKHASTIYQRIIRSSGQK